MGRRSLLMAGAGLLCAAAPSIPAAARPVARLETKWWRERHQAVLRRLQQGRVDLLLIGDSITQDLERTGPIVEMDFRPVWQHFYAPRNAVNLGFKGDATAHLLWRLRNGEIDGIAPRAAQLLIGANNFGRVRWGAADTFAGIEAVLAEMQKRLPRTRVLLLGVLPSKRSGWVDENTAALNRMLAERFRVGGDVVFADVSAFLLRDGAVDTDAFYDGKLVPPEPALHPTAQAHARMAEYLSPILDRLMRG